MVTQLLRLARLTAAAAFIAVILAPAAALAQSPAGVVYSTIYENVAGIVYTGFSGGLTEGPNGDLFGVNEGGGMHSPGGFLYSLTPAGAETDLADTFGAPGQGYQPAGSVIPARDGNFYGTTFGGGANGFGTIYKVTPDGVLSTLYSYGGAASDGAIIHAPGFASLVLGLDGDFYGVSSLYFYNEGVIYKFDPVGLKLLPLHVITGRAGESLSPILAIDSSGTVYGMANRGGAFDSGLLFSVAADGRYTDLHDFSTLSASYTNADGAYPYGGLTFGRDGSLYGFTGAGGTYGYGTGFRITPGGTLTTIYSQVPEPYSPPVTQNSSASVGPMILGTDGNFYGANTFGGTYGYGNLYEYTPEGVFTTLHDFDGNGAFPNQPLVEASDGTLYGTTSEGGDNLSGVAFSLVVPSLTSRPAITFSADTVGGGAAVTATVTIPEPAPTGGAVVDLFSSTPLISVPAAATIPAGQTSATFKVTTSPVTANVTGTITATYKGASEGVQLSLVPAYLNALVFQGGTTGNDSSGQIMSGQTTTENTVTLNGVATSDMIVNLSSDDSSLVLVQPTVVIKAGTSSSTFTMTGKTVTQPSATYVYATSGNAEVYSYLTVIPGDPVLRAVTLRAPSTQGGSKLTENYVYLKVAPAADTIVQLTSSNLALASVPPTVEIRRGYTSYRFDIQTQAVTTPQTVTITATLGTQSEFATLTLTPGIPEANLSSLTIDPPNIAGGAASTGTITLSAVAPPGGALVHLTSDSPSAAVPATVLVPNGESTADFNIPTTSVAQKTTANITATYKKSTLTAPLLITGSYIASVFLTPNQTHDANPSTATGAVTLNGIAHTDMVVTLVSSLPSVVAIPATVTIKAGTSTATFPMTITPSPDDQEEVQITAIYKGVYQEATFTLY